MRYAAVQIVQNVITGEREPRLYCATKYPEFRSWKKSKEITKMMQEQFPTVETKDGNCTQRVWFYNLSEKAYNEMCGN